MEWLTMIVHTSWRRLGFKHPHSLSSAKERADYVDPHYLFEVFKGEVFYRDMGPCDARVLCESIL